MKGICIMKKVLSIVVILCLVFSICGCSNTKNAKIDYGKSDIFSKEDMDSAIKVIIKEFNEMKGCKLYSLKYMGDDFCKENINYANEVANELRKEKKFTECIVFTSTFRSPLLGGDAWIANEVYEGWEWYLARTENGSWELLTYGWG